MGSWGAGINLCRSGIPVALEKGEDKKQIVEYKNRTHGAFLVKPALILRMAHRTIVTKRVSERVSTEIIFPKHRNSPIWGIAFELMRSSAVAHVMDELGF